MTPRTHAEHATATKVATPCTAHHVNYGGGCLNCGWTPRPTDAELVKPRHLAKLLRHIYRNALGSSENLRELVMVLGPTADALEAASVEPRTYGDGEARYATPEAAATDSVSVWDTFDEYDYKWATRRDVIRAVLRSVGMETQESYTFTEGR